MTDTIIAGLDINQILGLIVVILSGGLGTSVYKNVQMYWTLAKKEVHAIRNAFDILDSAMQSPNVNEVDFAKIFDGFKKIVKPSQTT